MTRALILLLACACLSYPAPARGPQEKSPSPKTEFLPLLSYDTDAGLGYGLKLFLREQLHARESFDLVLFNSTKGERWYRFVFSAPDFELRHGTEYPFALDVTVDYDKWIAYSFFGIGNGSSFDDRVSYTREPLEVSASLSRGFTRDLVGGPGLRFKTIRNFDLSASAPPELTPGSATYLSVFGTLRLDTRDSYINPSRGIVLEGQLEAAPSAGPFNVPFSRAALWAQGYTQVLSERVILAARAGIQSLGGGDLPVQVLLPVGGGSTLRGSVQDRYLDRVSVVTNLELRFPVFWRFGGIAGVDAGEVWHSLSDLGLRRWPVSPILGLRLYMDTFIVRLDLGFGRETTGFYLNFGHLF